MKKGEKMRKKFYKAVAIMIAVNMMSFTVFAAETVDAEIPTADPPVVETPVGDDTPSEEPKQEEPVKEEQKQEEPKQEEPAQEEPKQEEQKQEEPVKEEQKQEEPVKEEPKQEEPVKEEPKQEEPVKEEKKAEDQKPEQQTQDNENKEESKQVDKNENPSSDVPGTDNNQNSDDKNKKSESSDTVNDNNPSGVQNSDTNGLDGKDNDVTQVNPENSNVNSGNADDKDTGASEELTERRDAQFQEMSEESVSSDEEPSNQNDSWSNDPVIEDVMGVRAGVSGDDVIIEYKVKHTNEWENIAQGNPLTVTYTDSNGNEVTKQIQVDYNYNLHGENWSSIDAKVSKYSDQNDTEIIRMVLPSSYFGTTDLQISGGKYTTTLNSNGIQSSSPSSAVYTGITMDGTFNDWDAVQKTSLVEPDGKHNVESVAMQIDSDYVYIYIKDDGSNSATWAGPNSNGKYAITTDLGRTLVFQLTQDGAVVGADGAISNHQGSQWEIAIPTSSLPQNNGGLNFGLYLTEPSISGHGDISNVGSSTGISYDGHYGDWSSFPVTEIQYSTAGTHENVPDGEAAIYVDDNVYGYCTTSMQAHLDETGGEFTQAVTVLANDDWSHALYMRLASVDDAGNIDWNPQKNNLEDGSYEYYIFATDAWGTSQNISSLVDADVCYGKATITITEGRHDMEWYVDSNKLAARYGIAETDLKKVSSQYGRIGQQLVTSGGASSGPWGGAALCILSAAAPFVLKKKFVF